jgi:group II intron reverse transcriptase/maturase
MQTAERILQVMHSMGVKRMPLTRVYRMLFSEDLYLAAYAKIARNEGALTPGTDGETADGMSLEVIRDVIKKLRHERFEFRPVRSKGIPKKNGGIRNLGMPDFVDKLVQEVLRMLLEAYYEPRFRDCSHGYRPHRGCHTALRDIKQHFRGAAWFIEGDIKGCFDNISHEVLMAILARDIHDGRLLNLIRKGLKAGKLENWKRTPTYSGTPQGGILSPLLSNIYLNELDEFVEDVLIPRYTRGKIRQRNPLDRQYEAQLRKVRKTGDKEHMKQLEKEQRLLPSLDMDDPNFRRLQYVRYADDFILAFIGTKVEAESIRDAIAQFLHDHLKLNLSAEKTLITHATTEDARFLGYAIRIYQENTQLAKPPRKLARRRSVNGHVRLGIPYGLTHQYAQPYLRNGKTTSQAGLTMYSAAHIIDVFQARFRGIANYYRYAVDRSHLNSLKYIMEQALVKTLAHKYRVNVTTIYRRYRGIQTVNGQQYPTLQVEVPTKHGMRLIYWGAVPLKVDKRLEQTLNETKDTRWGGRTDLLRRLQADRCEICGSRDRAQVHHVRKLVELKRRWEGRKEKPVWVARMITMQRKTLIVCHHCHVDIHAGRTPKLSQRNLESRMT